MTQLNIRNLAVHIANITPEQSVDITTKIAWVGLWLTLIVILLFEWIK